MKPQEGQGLAFAESAPGASSPTRRPVKGRRVGNIWSQFRAVSKLLTFVSLSCFTCGMGRRAARDLKMSLGGRGRTKSAGVSSVLLPGRLVGWGSLTSGDQVKTGRAPSTWSALQKCCVDDWIKILGSRPHWGGHVHSRHACDWGLFPGCPLLPSMTFSKDRTR